MEIKTFVMNNDKQRREFARNYTAWGLWYTDHKINVDYYKCVLPDGTQVVVAQSPDTQRYFGTVEFSTTHVSYHLIPQGENFTITKNNITEFIALIHTYRGNIEIKCNFGEPETVFNSIQLSNHPEYLANILADGDYCKFCDNFNAEHCEFIENHPNEPLYNGCILAAMKFLNSPFPKWCEKSEMGCENE